MNPKHKNCLLHKRNNRKNSKFWVIFYSMLAGKSTTLLLRDTVTYIPWELLITTVITRVLFPTVTACQSPRCRKGVREHLTAISALSARRLKFPGALCTCLYNFTQT